MPSLSIFDISNVQALNLSKPSPPNNVINTGVGFFDHMIDQLNSHAQVGVSVQVLLKSDNATMNTISNGDNTIDNAAQQVLLNRNRYGDSLELQEELMTQVGLALGEEIHKLLPPPQNKKSRFCCPLDEALVECIISSSSDHNGDGAGTLSTFALAPYGIYPKSTGGRTKIGHMMTAPLEHFFAHVAKGSGLNISLIKRRGDNGHHVVESAFKAFSRALRNYIDGTDVDAHLNSFDGGDGITSSSSTATANLISMWGNNSLSYKEGIDMSRCGKSSRATKETSIDVDMKLDGGQSGVSIDTSIQSLNDFYEQMAKEANISLNVACNGDTWVDDHHTSEDVSIAIGKVLNTSLGTKAGLNRMWCAASKVGEACVEVTMDLSNRPCLTHDLSLSTSNCEYIGDMSTEMFDHVLESLVMNAQMTVHIIETSSGNSNGNDSNIVDLMMATASAFGKALRFCAAVDPRRAGKTASSKGTLSA
jgi:imidazoleglycerol-phosphate dehydratase